MPVSKTYTPTEGYTEIVVPGKMGITQLHFGVLTLSPESTFFDRSEDTEVALIALAGHCTLLVGHNGNKAYGVLGERADVFHDEACVAHIPRYTTYEMLIGESGMEVAVCKVESYTESAAAILEAGETLPKGETQLRFWEQTLSSDSEGNAPQAHLKLTETEAICFHKFRDADGTAVFRISRSTESLADTEAVRVTSGHNDLLVLPVQHEIVSLTTEGSGYQLWVQPM